MNTSYWPVECELQTRVIADAVEERIFATHVPDNALVETRFIEQAKPEYLHWVGSPDDGYRLAMHFANGDAEYETGERVTYPSEDVDFWECKLVSWRPKTWEPWAHD